MSKMYVFTYKLPNGELVGYHADSFCSVIRNKARAKKYPLESGEIQKQLDIIKKNFKSIWEDIPSYRASSVWKGHTHEEILLTPELI